MEISSFDFYGRMARSEDVHITIQNGRYISQNKLECNIFKDIQTKLQLSSTDSVLDIGCGTCLILDEVSNHVKSVMGIDHEDVINKYSKELTQKNIDFRSGNFLDCIFTDSFDKIYAYSVLHCLDNYEDLYKFIDKVLGLIKPSGTILLGDIPNSDKKRRFESSKFGQEFYQTWSDKNNIIPVSDILITDTLRNSLISFNDQLIQNIFEEVRKRGFDLYILPQPNNLPFCYTREDILIVNTSG